jgi:hypothetical protein
MVAGALAMVADVTVYASQGTEVRRFTDGVFEVVELGTDSPQRTESERLLAGLEYLAGQPTARQLIEQIATAPGQVADLVGVGAFAHWAPAGPLLSESRPDLVVVADYLQSGATDFAASRWPHTPVVVVPLVPAGASDLVPAFASTFTGAAVALVFTEQERSAVQAATEAPVRRMAVPVTSNPSVLRSPHEQLGDHDYVAVITDSRWESSSSYANQARLLVSRFAEQTFAIAATDQLVVFSGGRSRSAMAVGRGSDLLRLMAWAGATVDLRPGAVFARRCLQSLVHGTPILVPATSRGREHAELGRGGLWFDGSDDLCGAAEALFDQPLRDSLCRQSAGYVEERCKETEGFVDDVLSVLRSVADVLPSDVTVGDSVADVNVS